LHTIPRPTLSSSLTYRTDSMKLALPIFALLAVAVTQSTCPCRANTAETCSTIQEDIVVDGSLTCRLQPVPCAGCLCDSLGSDTCQVETRSHLVFNGTGQFCEIVSKDVALCPDSVPASNITSCCINTGVGSVQANNCELNSPTGSGITDPITRIYRFIDAAYNSSGTFTNGDSEISFQAIIGIESEYSTTEFSNAGVPTDLFSDTSSTQSSTPVTLAPNEVHNFDISLVDEVGYGAYEAGSTEYNQMFALPGNTFNFDFDVFVVQLFPAGTSQITRWGVAHCVAYEIEVSV